MMGAANFESLHLISGASEKAGDVICLFLTHNEGLLLRDFISYYRAMGGVHFVAIDDRSTDGSLDFLKQQDDVTVLTPREGTVYSTHKRTWRSEALDHFGVGTWCLLPDVDERLVWHDHEKRPFRDLIRELDGEGAEALYCTMVDMYADRPIADHVYEGGSLQEHFPLFDDPEADPLNYRVTLTPSRFRRKWPVPNMQTTGGMRDRLFFDGVSSYSPLGRAILRRGTLGKPRQVSGARLWLETLSSRFTKAKTAMPKLDLTKLALLRWRRGTLLNGGPHYVSIEYRLSRERAVLLHYPFTRGVEGAKYIAQRAQHAGQGYYYSSVVESDDLLRASPCNSGTKRYRTSSDLGPLVHGG